MKLKPSTNHEMLRGIQDIQMDIDESNKHIIMNMLRSQIYSNPIESFVRELISNAVDAHARAGKQDVPFEIWAPTETRHNFIIRDYGNSMTPDVIANVYSKMGSSDKRDSNKELGAFGIGAASPLAYTNLFYIETYTLENEVVTYRKWAQYVDSTQMGKLSLLEEQTVLNEPTGTCITVPTTNGGDLFPIHTAIIQYTTYLKVKPKIHDCSIKHDTKPPVFFGENWKWYEEGIELSSTSSKPTAVVGGVPYPISGAILTQIREQGNSSNLPLIGINIFLKQRMALFFNIGELDLSANREHLQYTAKTIHTLLHRLKQVLEETKVIVASKVHTAPNYLQACQKWYSLPQAVRGILQEANFKWNGRNFTQNISIASKDFDIRSYAYRAKSYYDTTQVIRSNTDHYIHIRPSEYNTIAVYLNDTGTRRVSSQYTTYLIDTCGIECLYILQPEKEGEEGCKIDPRDKELLGVQSLAEVKDRLPKEERKERSFGFIEGYYLPDKMNHRPRATGATAWFETEKYPVDQGGVYVIFEENWYIMRDAKSKDSSSNEKINESTLRTVVKLLGITRLYGFKRAVVHRLADNWIPLTDIIDDKLDEWAENVDLQYVINVAHEREDKKFIHQVFESTLPILLTDSVIKAVDPESPFNKYYQVSKECEGLIQKLSEKLIPLLFMSNKYLEFQQTDITKYYDEVMSRYSIIRGLGNSSVRSYKQHEDVLAKGFADYINLIDENISKDGKEKRCTISIPKTWAALMETLST